MISGAGVGVKVGWGVSEGTTVFVAVGTGVVVGGIKVSVGSCVGGTSGSCVHPNNTSAIRINR